jgi:hypothetical protein
MPSYYLSPIGNDQQVSSAGAPLSGGKIFTYLAGTSTASATYTDNTGATPQANPIILNSLGLPTSPIWLLGGFPLKFIIKDSADVTIRTVDNISGINDTSSTASEWTSAGITPTYISATQFSVVGDQTSIFQVNRRVRTTNTGGLIYGRITVTSFGAGITTVTVVNDTGSMDAGLSAVAYGFLSFSPTSIPFALYAGFGTNQIQPISAVANTPANSLTISASLLGLEFRSATLTSGNVTSVSGTPSNLVVPSTATLGTTNAVQSRLLVLALNNAGIIELAVVNSSGVNNLSETGVISTTAISAGATSASVVYSTTARSNLAYRVLGYIESTQATAGTWVTAPSVIQGNGGQPKTKNVIAQIQTTVTGAVATGTTVLPFDDTIPQITEGDQFMSLAITPTNASSLLEIDVTVWLLNSVSNHVTAALFQDSTANAIAVQDVTQNANWASCITFKHIMTAGTTSATTFRLRGGAISGTTTFNGTDGGVRKFGGLISSRMTIKEYLP